MKWIYLMVGLAVAPSVLAAPATPAPSSEERYLFIVDTSASMERLARECRQTIFDFVYWGVDGHMRPGDTYGIWTVDEDLHAGEFPMQVWRGEQQIDLATKASVFLKDQRYRKEPNYGKLTISLLTVVMNVQDVNIFIITDAEAPLVGIPLDNQIRQACATRAKERAAANKPFVIYLNARHGEIQSATVALAGESFKLQPRDSSGASHRQRSVLPTSVNNKRPAGHNIALGQADPRREGALVATQPAASPPLDKASEAAMKPTPRATPDTRAPAASETKAVVKSEIAQAVSERPAVSHNPPPTKADAALAAISQPASASADLARPPPIDSQQLQTIAARERQPGTVAAAAPTPLEPVLSPTELFVVAGVLLLIFVGLILSFRRRLPHASGRSSITRSMDDRD